MRTLKTRSKLAVAGFAVAAAVVGGSGVANAYSSNSGEPSGATDWLSVSSGNYWSWGNENYGQICNDQSSGNSFTIKVIDQWGNPIIQTNNAWISSGGCVGVYGSSTEMWFPAGNHEGFDIQVISNGRVVAESGMTYVS